MVHFGYRTIGVCSLALLWACGSEGGGTPGSHSTPAVEQAESPEGELLTDSGTCTKLTVKNFDSWCKVSVNGGKATNAPVQTVCVDPGRIKLAATPESATFELGPTPWHDTAGDTGSGDPGHVTGDTSHTTVVVKKKAACVWACCPFSSGGGGCPTTDDCP